MNGLKYPQREVEITELINDIYSKDLTILSDDHGSDEFVHNQKKILQRLPLDNFEIALEFKRREDMISFSPLRDILDINRCHILYLTDFEMDKQIVSFLNIYSRFLENPLLTILGIDYIETISKLVKSPKVIVNQCINGVYEKYYSHLKKGIYLLSKEKDGDCSYLIRGLLD